MKLNTINLSTLAEMMGDYTETEARSFRAYLLDQGITDTDQIEDHEWGDTIILWEVEENIAMA